MRLKDNIDLGLFYGHTDITIPIRNEDRQEAINWLKSLDVHADDEIVIELKKKRQRRSLSANAYFWQLVNKVAVKLNSSDQDVYRNLVKDFGVSTTLRVRDEAKEAFIRAWTAGKDSSGWFVEDLGHEVVRAYSGTSTYSTKEMSRIIDGLVEECKALNIETMTPDELAHLKSTWKQER